METHAALSSLDDHARLLAGAVIEGEVTNSEAARSILAHAVDRGVVSQQIRAAHGSAISRIRHEADEFIGAATFMLVGYTLPKGQESPLDVSQFSSEDRSATGWVRRTIASFRPSRIEREIRYQGHVGHLEDEIITEVAAPEADPSEHSVPDDAEVIEATKDRRKGGETLLFIHASVLYELTGGPALRWWSLSDSERAQLLRSVESDPGLPMRSLRGSDDHHDESDMVRELWADWSDPQIEDVIAKSSADRDIVGLLTRAAVTPFPKPPPGNRGRDERAMRRRAQEGIGGPRDLSAALFDSFMASKVATYCDKDRRRAPLDCDAAVERRIAARSFPLTLSAVAHCSELSREDLLSALVRLTLEHVPALNPDHFAPGDWSFPAEKALDSDDRRPLDKE